ncbi:MAG: serine/threonine-protein kinase, partial [Candidatus Eiseniibacteriota bacterium]
MVGRTIGHYRVLEQIGSGGMGVVYRVRDESLERDVVLKVLPAETLADPVARARLLREARSAAALNHANICTIHEVGEQGDQAFIAMELVDGQSLAELVGPKGMPPSMVLRYGIEIADALAHAHGRGSGRWGCCCTRWRGGICRSPDRRRTRSRRAIMHAPPRALPESVPAGLRAVIARCLEKESAHRYARAGEVRAALEALQ